MKTTYQSNYSNYTWIVQFVLAKTDNISYIQLNMMALRATVAAIIATKYKMATGYADFQDVRLYAKYQHNQQEKRGGLRAPK